MRIFHTKDMFFLQLVIFIIFIFLLFIGKLCAAESLTESLISKSEKAVVELISEEGATGTGFFINDSGLILTNQHVVGNVNDNVRIALFKYEKRYTGTVIHADKELDLALVQANTKVSHPRLHIDTFDNVGRGDNIFIIGHPHIKVEPNKPPRQQPWESEYGAVTRLTRDSNVLKHLFKHNITTYGGNSGGPVISSDTGYVIGVVKSKFDSINYSFAINSNTVLRWLRSLPVKLPNNPNSNSDTTRIPNNLPKENFTAGIATGRSGGTYKTMGDDINSLVSDYGINLTVISDEKGDGKTTIGGELQPTTIGSIKNIELINRNPWIKAGMVQTDVLQYLRRDEKRKELAERIRFLLPLHTEEVHVIARKDVTSLSDLKDGPRIIAVDKEDSGTFLTATTLLESMGIDKERYMYIGGSTALDYLVNGRIDAMFYVAGYPAELLKQNISSDLHMLEVNPADLGSLAVGKDEIYQPAQIPGNAEYPWLDRDVSTISVRAVLMTFNYKNKDCRAVRHMANTIKSNYKTLLEKNPRHWESVNLTLKEPKGWTAFQPEQCNPQ